VQIDVTGPVFEWRGPAPHHFVAVDDDAAALIAETAAAVTYGWGMVPVRLTLGGTTWTTSLWPREGGYVVPLKLAARRAESVVTGDVVTVRVEIDL